MSDFLIHALWAGSVIAIIAGPLGCFVVWRRMAYFGEAIAHSALLGVALALFFAGILMDMSEVRDEWPYRTGLMLIENPWPVVLVVSLLLAASLTILQRRNLLPRDTLLGIVAHGALALGLVIMASMPTLRVDILSYLFGDVLNIGLNDAIIITVFGVLVMFCIVYWWRPLLSMTVNPQIAAVEGIAVGRIEMLFVLLLATVVAVGMRLVGTLLIIALLIIPPAAARRLVGSPFNMAIVAALIGLLDVWLGVAMAWYFDLPAGPAIVVVAAMLFILVLMWPSRQPTVA